LALILKHTDVVLFLLRGTDATEEKH